MEELINGKPCYLVDATEENKSINKVLQIMDELVKLPSRRNTNLIAIGGGIIQDISAFTANVMYRGIPWVFIPTTLLAQTDSCIGVKPR